MVSVITLPVMNVDGQQVGSVEIDPAELGVSVNKQLLHDAVLMYQANQRQGTAKTKSRGEVAGSGRKLYRQKGTGNARVGDRRTAKRRGGGTAFGPTPRDYSYSMPKKARRLATRMALLSKLLDDEAVVVDELPFSEPKTRRMAQVLGQFEMGGASCLVAIEQPNPNLYLSARNLAGVEILPVQQLNAYELLRRKRLLITRAALEEFRKIFATHAKAAAEGA